MDELTYVARYANSPDQIICGCTWPHCTRRGRPYSQTLKELPYLSNLLACFHLPAMASSARYKLVFFAPASALSACKAAIFAAGAGSYPGPGNYTECCWQASGTGQFRPGDAANPNIGEVGKLETIDEVRVETLCINYDVAKKAVDALKKCVAAQRSRSEGKRSRC